MFRGLCIIEDQGGSTVAWTTLPRLDNCAAVVLVGSRLGAAILLAESFNSLYKAELIQHTGLWADVLVVEATVEYVEWST